MDSNPNPSSCAKHKEEGKKEGGWVLFVFTLLVLHTFFNNQFNITRYYDLDAFMEIEPDLYWFGLNIQSWANKWFILLQNL